MVVIKLLLFALLISISNEGSCGITTKATKYTHCRDKKPYDERNNVCCYLKGTSNNGTIERCVEIRREDIDGDNFKKTKDAIKAGTYDKWLPNCTDYSKHINCTNYTDFLDYDGMTISKIDSIRCNNSQFLKYIGLLAILFIFY